MSTGSLAATAASQRAVSGGTIVVGDRRIDARDPFRRDAAGDGDDPALELFETRRLSAEIVVGLFEPEPAGVNDEVIEVAFVLGRGLKMTVAGGHGARP